MLGAGAEDNEIFSRSVRVGVDVNQFQTESVVFCAERIYRIDVPKRYRKYFFVIVLFETNKQPAPESIT